MSMVDDAMLEIEGAILAMAPAHEGLRDYAALDLRPESLSEVQSAISRYDQRLALLSAARDHLAALQADGFPSLELPPVTATVLDDLRENASTIAAALGKFRAPAQASTLGLSADAPEPKA